MGFRLGLPLANRDQLYERRTFLASLTAAVSVFLLRPRPARARRLSLPPQIVWAASDFEPLVGSRFELIDWGSGGEYLRLESVTEIGRPGLGGPSGRAPFSLIFKGHPDGPRDQETYHLRHPTLGETALLLVPVYHAGRAPRFEAVIG
jgi:hypothetical protein